MIELSPVDILRMKELLLADNSTIKTLMPAMVGLVGVVLGGVLTISKDVWLEHRKNRREREYATVLLLGELDRLIRSCSAVSADDGLIEGNYGENGCREPQTSEPKFDPNSLDVNWKCFPAKVIYEVFDLPRRLASIEAKLANIIDYGDGPPDFKDWFQERRRQYAEFGCSLITSSNQLRIAVGLREMDYFANSFMERDMKDLKDSIDREERERELRSSEKESQSYLKTL